MSSTPVSWAVGVTAGFLGFGLLLAGGRAALEGPIREAPPVRELQMVAPASRKALVFSGITDTLDVGGIIPAQSIVVLQYGDTFFFHVPAMRVQ